MIMHHSALTFEPISKDNLDLIVEVQNRIFPGESAKQNYLETIEKNPYRKELANWLVLHESRPIGVVGLYSYYEYPQTAWLGWFGVLPEERGKKYGSDMFEFWLDIARHKGYTEARLYTDKFANQEALGFYTNKGMIQEEYLNMSEGEEITHSTVIFSLSLTDKHIAKWDNKFLELSEQIEKQK